MPIFREEKQTQQIELLRKKEEEELARVLSQKYGLGYVDLTQHAIDTDALRLVAEAKARAASVAAFARANKKISLAVKSPSSEETKEVSDDLIARGYEPIIYMTSMQGLTRAWERYKDLSFATETKAGILDISTEEIGNLKKTIKSLTDAKHAVEEVLGMKRVLRTSRILETVLAGAFALDASDIHIEPEEANVRLRYRMDGVLIDVLFFDRETHDLLLSRIKLLSGLKLNVRDAAQDGRFSVRLDNSDIEIRTSVLPGNYAESIVMRLLDPSTIAVPMEALGIEPRLYSVLETEIKRPNGMILNTGPTGSGKTTSLYAFLRKIHSPEIKIITIEDPVEYHLPGLVQTQVEKHYTFAQGLRAALRQDPDVIMVGEIRDAEVAETAINAALTGHLVFSTLHTNSAAGAFPRLIDLGINAKTIGSSVNAVIAQRLVRKLRPESRKEMKLEGKEAEFVAKVLATISDPSYIPENKSVVWEPNPIDGNENLAYSGRLGVFEVIKMSAEIETAVESQAGEHEIQELARSQHTLTMVQDAVVKALQGVTSLSEIRRILDVTKFES